MTITISWWIVPILIVCAGAAVVLMSKPASGWDFNPYPGVIFLGSIIVALAFVAGHYL